MRRQTRGEREETMLTVNWVLLVVGLGVAAFVGSAGMLLALSLVSMNRQAEPEPPYAAYDDDDRWEGDYASVDGPTMPVSPMAPAMARYQPQTSSQASADAGSPAAGVAWVPSISRPLRPWEAGPLELDRLHTGVEEIEEGPGLWN